jgi:lauroyl/myristoyl acyltransferase
MQRTSSLRRSTDAPRIDGLWLRKLANLGSVYAPEWFKRGAPPLIAAASFSLVAQRRRGAVRNLERVLGVDRWTAHWAALRMFSEFAYCTSEAMEHYSSRPKPVEIDRPRADAVLSALARGRGVVLVTGHVGSWDIAAKALGYTQRRIHVVMSREADAATDEFVRAMRSRAGVHVVLSDASVFSSLRLIRALKRNEIVAIQLDRPAGASGVRWLPFLGAPAPFPSGAFVLARLAGAPVVPVFAPRLGKRHYRIHVGEIVSVPRAARDPQVLDGVMLEVVAQLEEIVRRYPWQWFQFAPFWPEPAQGAGAVAVGEEADLLAASGPRMDSRRRR